jgi:hypothetical protein
MMVTPTTKKFGKYAPGDSFELRDKSAKLLIKVGKLRAVEPAPASGYLNRAMTAAAPAAAVGPQYLIKVAGEDVALDNLTGEELHTLAKSLDVKVHHLAGAVKVRQALLDSQSEAAQ